MLKTCEHPKCLNLVKTKQARFCSLSCANSVNKTKRGKGPKPRVCKLDTCFEVYSDYTKTREFCSHSCSAKFHNESRKLPSKTCPGCGTTMAYGRKYCSVVCRQQTRIKLWLAGELDGCAKYTYASYVKQYLEERSGGTCEMVDCTENRTRPDGSGILQVDHIDGNWEHNSPNNVRFICPSCHALTENWGGQNRGNGRTWKAKYNQFKPLDN